MDTEKENVTKEVVKEIDTKNEKKKEKLFTVPGSTLTSTVPRPLPW